MPIPANEDYRQSVLDSLQILDTETEERFDRITRLAARLFSVPICLVTLVDRDRQWFKSAEGTALKETCRDDAFCAHTIMTGEGLVVRETRDDPRFVGNALVTGAPHIRFYAGAPLTMPEGVRLGSLCLIDTKPRPDFTDADFASLTDLAAVVVDEILLRATFQRLEAENDAAKAGARDAQQAGERAKQQFLAIVGHELKTPLNGIIGFASVMEQGLGGAESPERVREYAGLIRRSGERLNEVVDSVLTYSQAQSGELTLAEVDTQLDRLVRDGVDAVLSEAILKETKIGIDLGSAGGSCVRVDPLHMQHMIMQLVSNAVRFSGDEATVLVSARFEDAGLVLSVADQGPGIPEARLADATTAFSQLDDSLARSHEGLGLGLPLTGVLARAHGGRLRLANRAPTGLVAEIMLPPWRVVEAPGVALEASD